MANGLTPITRASDESTTAGPLPAHVAMSGERPAASHPALHRFRTALALLVGIAIGAIVVALAALGGGHGGPAGRWSDWKPSDGGTQGAQEIADHLAPLYRLSGVNQLAVITVSSLGDPSATAQASTGGNTGSSSSNGPMQVAVRPSGASSLSLISGKTLTYNLCGLGSSNCSIGIGTPSPDRLLLLRREALELALYTFKYIGGVQNVVALLPPGHTEPASTLTSKPPSPAARRGAGGHRVDIALLFLRDELSPFLSQPLSATLPVQPPPTVPEVPVWRGTTEAARVAQITSLGMFTDRITTAQDGSKLLVLEQQPPQ